MRSPSRLSEELWSGGIVSPVPDVDAVLRFAKVANLDGVLMSRVDGGEWVGDPVHLHAFWVDALTGAIHRAEGGETDAEGVAASLKAKFVASQ